MVPDLCVRFGRGTRVILPMTHTRASVMVNCTAISLRNRVPRPSSKVCRSAAGRQKRSRRTKGAVPAGDADPPKNSERTDKGTVTGPRRWDGDGTARASATPCPLTALDNNMAHRYRSRQWDGMAWARPTASSPAPLESSSPPRFASSNSSQLSHRTPDSTVSTPASAASPTLPPPPPPPPAPSFCSSSFCSSFWSSCTTASRFTAKRWP